MLKMNTSEFLIKVSLLCSALIICTSAFGQSKAFQLYNSKGKKVKYKKLVKSCEKGNIVFFGELHNNPISHWLQLELTQSLAKEHNLILGAEMIEADNQQQLNAYLSEELNAKQLDSARPLCSALSL